MIVTFCGDKPSPGVTTGSVAASVVWPGERLLLEADPSGGDLALWLRGAQGEQLALEDRSVTSLAAAARDGLPVDALGRHAQQTGLGFAVLVAPMSAEGFEPMTRLWPQMAATAHAWPGTVIADLGRLQLRHGASPLAAASTAVVLLTRAGRGEDLFHVRQRAHELAGRLGQGPHGRSPLVVAVLASAREADGCMRQVRQALASQATTSTIPVAGWLAEDRRAVAELRAGQLTKRLLGSDLLKSATELVARLTALFPELVGMPAPPAVTVPMTPVEQYQARWVAPAARSTEGGLP